MSKQIIPKELNPWRKKCFVLWRKWTNRWLPINVFGQLSKSLPKVDKKVLTRVRDVKTNGGRKAISYPMPICPAQVLNMRRHLSFVHNVSTTEEQQAFIAKGKVLGQEEARMSNPVRRQKYYSLCQKALSRVAFHFVHCHKLKRGSGRFREIFQSVRTTGIIFFLLTDYSMIATCVCLPTPKLYFFFLSLQCVPVAGEETTENVAEASLNKEQHTKQWEK